MAAWPGPETKGDPTSNIQIRKLPRPLPGTDYPLSASLPSLCSHSPALNLHILLFAKPHAIPAATVGRAAFKRLPAYFPTIFDQTRRSSSLASFRIVVVAMLGRPSEPTVFALVLVATRLRGPYTYLLAVRGEAAALKQGTRVCPARSNRATGISSPFLRRLKRPSHFVRLPQPPRPLLKLPSLYLPSNIFTLFYLASLCREFFLGMKNRGGWKIRAISNIERSRVEDRVIGGLRCEMFPEEEQRNTGWRW